MLNYHKPQSEHNVQAMGLKTETASSVSSKFQTLQAPEAAARQAINLPLDVLPEIVLNLGPYDILRLARVSRRLRNFLMNRRERHGWQRAIETFNMPQCPSNMSEPAYISYVFERICSGCGCESCDSDGPNMIREFNVRLCKTCYKDRFSPSSELMPDDEFSRAPVSKNFRSTQPHRAVPESDLNNVYSKYMQFRRHWHVTLEHLVSRGTERFNETQQLPLQLLTWAGTRIRDEFLEIGTYDERDLRFPIWCKEERLNFPDDDYWRSVLRQKCEDVIIKNRDERLLKTASERFIVNEEGKGA